jgi:hypothetical protein
VPDGSFVVVAIIAVMAPLLRELPGTWKLRVKR